MTPEARKELVAMRKKLSHQIELLDELLGSDSDSTAPIQLTLAPRKADDMRLDPPPVVVTVTDDEPRRKKRRSSKIREGTKIHELLTWIRSHPEKEFTTLDLAKEFPGVPMGTVSSGIHFLVRRRYLSVIAKSGSAQIYRAIQR